MNRIFIKLKGKAMTDVFAFFEDVISKTINNIGRVDWNEDFITRTLLSNLRQNVDGQNFRNIHSDKIKVHFNSFKFTGKREAKYGDICMIFRILRFKDNPLEGVAFIEAKKRNPNENNFKELKKEQIERQISNSPKALLLFYDLKQISSRNIIAPAWVDNTNCVVTQSSLVLELATKDANKLYLHSHSLSSQIAFRYFNGLDLEFDHEKLKAAKGYLEERDAPEFIAVINIIYNDKGDEVVDINEELFEEI